MGWSVAPPLVVRCPVSARAQLRVSSASLPPCGSLGCGKRASCLRLARRRRQDGDVLLALSARLRSALQLGLGSGFGGVGLLARVQMTKLTKRPPMATQTQPVMTSSSESLGNLSLRLDQRTRTERRIEKRNYGRSNKRAKRGERSCASCHSRFRLSCRLVITAHTHE